MSSVDWTPVIEDAKEALAAGTPRKRKWSSWKRIAGRKKVSAADRAALQAALEANGLTSIPAVDVVMPDGSDRITIASSASTKRWMPITFATEKELEELIAKSLPNVDELVGVERVATQYPVQKGDGRKGFIDILGRRRISSRNWRWFVIEVEQGDGKQESPAQVLAYAEALKRKKKDDGTPLVAEDDEIEVVVITQRPDHDAARLLGSGARDRGYDAKWFVAEMVLRELDT